MSTLYTSFFFNYLQSYIIWFTIYNKLIIHTYNRYTCVCLQVFQYFWRNPSSKLRWNSAAAPRPTSRANQQLYVWCCHVLGTAGCIQDATSHILITPHATAAIRQRCFSEQVGSTRATSSYFGHGKWLGSQGWWGSARQRERYWLYRCYIHYRWCFTFLAIYNLSIELTLRRSWNSCSTVRVPQWTCPGMASAARGTRS